MDIDKGTVSVPDQWKKQGVHTQSKGTKSRTPVPNIPLELSKMFVDKMTQVNRSFVIGGMLRYIFYSLREKLM